MSNSSKLLINEHPLQVLPSLAKIIGLNEAIVLQQVHYWLKIAEKAKDKSKFRNDCWWTFNTYKEWVENFPFWSASTIRRTIKNLEDMGLLVSEQMEAVDWNHTKWYTIDYFELNDLSILNTSNSSEWTDRRAQDGQILNKSSETSTETSTEIDPIETLSLYFSKITTLVIPKDGQGKPAFFWREPLEELYDLTGEDPEAAQHLIKQSVAHMDANELTISSPQSILKVARSNYAKRKRAMNGEPSSLWG